MHGSGRRVVAEKWPGQTVVARVMQIHRPLLGGCFVIAGGAAGFTVHEAIGADAYVDDGLA